MGQQLARSTMVDTDYLALIQHIELGTSHGDIPKSCELSEMSSTLDKLSVVTLKGFSCEVSQIPSPPSKKLMESRTKTRMDRISL